MWASAPNAAGALRLAGAEALEWLERVSERAGLGSQIPAVMPVGLTAQAVASSGPLRPLDGWRTRLLLCPLRCW